MTRICCSIYKSRRKPDTYLYVDKTEVLSRVPESLLEAFGTPELAFDFTLHPERRLARENAAQVLEDIARQGYHLQLPPPPDDYIQHLPEELLRLNDP